MNPLVGYFLCMDGPQAGLYLTSHQLITGVGLGEIADLERLWDVDWLLELNGE